MESKKDETVKIKSSLSQTRKIIAEKFRKLHMNNVLTERKLRKKYAPITDSLQKLIANKEKISRQQNDLNDQEMNDVFEMPPPPYPPPPLPHRDNQRRQQRDENVGPPPPVPPRPRSRSPHLPPSPTPQNREISRRFSLPQPVGPSSNPNSKRPRSMISSDGESDVFNLNRYKSEPKLPRRSFELIDYDNNVDHENIINERIDAKKYEKENLEDGAWGGVGNRALSSDNMYVEFIRPTSKSTEFIANSLKMNEKNRKSTSVVPHVQFVKTERKRVRDEVDSSVDILKTFNKLSEKKMDGMNNDDWSENDERNYKAVSAILSTDDFDENGEFIGGSEKRRKVVLALSKFNKKSIQKIKAKEKKGRGLEKNFIPYSENIVYEYWDDPNELCERLQLLLASKSAGNTNHDQEINSIIEELKERNIIA